MPFTSAEHLATQMHASQVTTLLQGITGDPFGEVDTMITRYTGIEPPADPDDADKLLRVIATRIVIWHITGRQQGVERDEWERRRVLYEEAMQWLEEIRSGVILLTPPAEPLGPQFRTDALRGGNW